MKRQKLIRHPNRASGRPPVVLGWREWVSLPNLRVQGIKAKLDTGARSSSLHVRSIETFRRAGEPWVSFDIVTDNIGKPRLVHAEAKIHDERIVRSSGGHEDLRIVIQTPVEIAGWQWRIDLTLAKRAAMSFRMLLGRQALSGHVLVDVSHSYLAGKPKIAPRR